MSALDLEYVQAGFIESHGAESYGIKILTTKNLVPVTLATGDVAKDYAQGGLARKLMDDYMAGMLLLKFQQDPEKVAQRVKTLQELQSYFPEGVPIYCEAIPNGYNRPDDPWAFMSPWLRVTTPIGHFKIGWRRRVINIDWNETRNETSGTDLFPEEDVTRGGGFSENQRYIHAWTPEKAREYILRIMENCKVYGPSY